MISLEFFKKIMHDIKKQEEKDDKLTKLLVDDNCYGWVSTCNTLIDDIIALVKSELGDGYDYIDWWLYDISDGDKFVYESIDDEYDCRFDLNDLDNLYYYITGDLENVAQTKVEKQKNDTFTSTCTIDDLKKEWGIEE